MKLTCKQCGADFDCSPSRANRASKNGSPLFCGRTCAGLNRRRPPKSDKEKRLQKAEYDAARRARLADLIKAQKAAHYQKTRNPEKEREVRKARMHLHVEYCRRPEYRAKKKEYDQIYRAKQEAGEFWESLLLAMQIRRECLERMDDTEIRRSAGTLNKHQTRRRDYDRTHSNKPEIGSLGNLE